MPREIPKVKSRRCLRLCGIPVAKRYPIKKQAANLRVRPASDRPSALDAVDSCRG